MDGLTREKLIEVAAGLHDEAGCSCDRRYPDYRAEWAP